MKRTMLRSAVSAIAAAFLIAGSAAMLNAADDLAAARELYASAAYEEALDALNRARATGVATADVFAVEQYRAFCLLALGRGAEAQSAIENLVLSNPLYQPSPSDVSPRVRAAFSEVRRRLLPTIIPQQYAKAKAAFDKKDYAAASTGFNEVLRTLADPEIAQAAGESPLADLRTLAVGFQELSVTAAAPPPLPVAPPVQPVVPAPVPPAAPRIYTVTDTQVVPAVVLRQDLPGVSGRVLYEATGAVDIVINERGVVESATMRESVTPAYDQRIVEATLNWRYRPATLNGTPVKFRKLIQITLKPSI